MPGVVVDRTFGVKRRTRGIDQAKLSRAGEVGANDLADELTLRVAREVGDGNRILGSTHAGDVYSQLCLGRPGGKQAQGKQQPEQACPPRAMHGLDYGNDGSHVG